MHLSIIIPTYRRLQVLWRTLPVLLDQEFPPDDYEVIVVVGASNDGTLEALQAVKPGCGWQVLDQRPNSGQAEAKNIGIRSARGRLVLVLDDDVVCDRHLVSHHVAMHESLQRDAVVFGPVLVDAKSPRNLATVAMRQWTDDYMRDLESRGGVPRYPAGMWINSNCSVPRKALLAVGGFDSAMRVTHDDADLALKLYKHGLEFRYQPKAVTHQLYVKTPQTLVARDAPWAGRNDLVLSRRHPEYRQHSMLASMGSRGPVWRQFKRAAVCSPLTPDPLLRMPYAVTEMLQGVPPLRRAGIRLLRTRKALQMLRGAKNEAGTWEILEREFGVQLPVLMYHHVGPPRPGTLPNLTIAPEQFTRQMDWLARHGYQSITPEDWLQWVRSGKRLPQKPVMITFDDGYADLAEHAFPVLEKHGFRSLVFLVTGCIGGTNRWDSRISAHSHRLLDAGQIREWMRRAVQFGSHSRSHADLTSADIDLESEVHGSCEDLREILGEAPSAFCYPYGRSNEAVREHVSRHYAVAFTVEEGLNSLTTDVLGLRRTMIKAHESLSGFAQRTRLGKNQREYIYQKLAALFA